MRKQDDGIDNLSPPKRPPYHTGAGETKVWESKVAEDDSSHIFSSSNPYEHDKQARLKAQSREQKEQDKAKGPRSELDHDDGPGLLANGLPRPFQNDNDVNAGVAGNDAPESVVPPVSLTLNVKPQPRSGGSKRMATPGIEVDALASSLRGDVTLLGECSPTEVPKEAKYTPEPGAQRISGINHSHHESSNRTDLTTQELLETGESMRLVSAFVVHTGDDDREAETQPAYIYAKAVEIDRGGKRRRLIFAAFVCLLIIVVVIVAVWISSKRNGSPGAGTCGEGQFGNGVCPNSTMCCSSYGYCGTSEEHCGTCGGGQVGNAMCPDPRMCCSKYGFCGTSADYCANSTIATCGGGLIGDGICPDSTMCCSQYGYCGTTADYCGNTSVTTVGTCGEGQIGNGICPNHTMCCSEYGYCGDSVDHCGNITNNR